jgi:hypothetical protein
MVWHVVLIGVGIAVRTGVPFSLFYLLRDALVDFEYWRRRPHRHWVEIAKYFCMPLSIFFEDIMSGARNRDDLATRRVIAIK